MSDMYDGFEDWKDVQTQFEMDDPEPDEVLYASYECEYYEGWSTVIYRNGDKFYYNYAAHCSCYGLEGQWDPEEYTAELFIKAYEKGNWTIPVSVVNHVKEFLENKYNGA
jgi:hypothetical protein